MKNYRVERTQCRCHPESCNCNPWSVMDDGGVIIRAFKKSTADWLANRLNLADELEQLTYDFATGKEAGEKIIAIVHKAVA